MKGTLFASFSKYALPSSEAKKPSAEAKKPAAKDTKPTPGAKKPSPTAKVAEKKETIPPTASAEPRAKETTESTTRLKAHATKAKLPSPSFKILSDTPGSCRIECRLGGDTAIGTGRGLLLAREDAAEKLLSTIKKRTTLGITERKPTTQGTKAKVRKKPKT